MENLININQESVGSKIYNIRGEKVMLDFDLAEIYGYTVGAFNRQVRNNIEKFDADFRFQLTKEEYQNLKCNFCISSFGLEQSDSLRHRSELSSWGGDRHLPYAFTEQGIYMLMTVLHGDLATRQSKALIRIFHAMKNYILESNNYSLVSQVIENKNDIRQIRAELSETLKKSDISPILLNFSTDVQSEFVFLNGELAKATETYIDICSKAKKSIYIIDDYVGIKTLRQLRGVGKDVEITVFSDNKANTLRKSDYDDFRKEYPGVRIKFVKTNGLIHDRFIVIDSGDEAEKYYHLGASIKDTGSKVSMIDVLSEGVAKNALKKVLENAEKNEMLKLR